MLITARTEGRVRADPDPSRHPGQGRLGGDDPDQSGAGEHARDGGVRGQGGRSRLSANLKVTLQKQLFDMQAVVAQVRGGLQHRQAPGRPRRGAGQGATAAATWTPRFRASRRSSLVDRLQLEKKRMATYADQEKAQLQSADVKVDQLRADYKLKTEPGGAVEGQGRFRRHAAGAAATHGRGRGRDQKVNAGTPLGKVAQPSKLKAELKIAETQVKDIAIGQVADIDTRLAGGGWNGHDRGPGFAHRSVDSERHGDGGRGADEGRAAVRCCGRT